MWPASSHVLGRAAGVNLEMSVYISADRLGRRVAELGAEIDRAYVGRNPLLIGVLTSSVIFLADLARAICIPAEFDFLGLSSFAEDRSDRTRVQRVRFTSDLSRPVEGRHCIIVEDVVDTGMTLAYVAATLHARRPASLAVATLLDRPQRRLAEYAIAFRGFVIADDFVVGYGLDFRGRYRESPDLLVACEWPHA